MIERRLLNSLGPENKMNLVPILLPSTKISLFKSTESSLRESIISNDIKQVKKLLERDENIVNRDISEGDSHVRQSIVSWFV